MATKHTCGGPIFGRLAPLGECRRCDELHNGAPKVDWGTRRREQQRLAHLEAIRNHDCKASRCGPVCTAFDW